MYQAITERLSKEQIDSIYSKPEYFVPIKGYEGLYEISNFGNVKSLERVIYRPQGSYLMKEHIMKQRIASSGYRVVGLTDVNGVADMKLLHRLYATAFIPNSRNLSCVNHIDGDKLNNDLSNLEWTTYSFNNKHAFVHSLKNGLKGETASSSKFSNEEARRIREMFTYDNISIPEIASNYGVSRETIREIIRGHRYLFGDIKTASDKYRKINSKISKPVSRERALLIRADILAKQLSLSEICKKYMITWSQLERIKCTPNYGIPHRRAYWLKPEVVTQIKDMLEKGYTQSSICKQLNVSKSQVSKISLKLSYK